MLHILCVHFLIPLAPSTINIYPPLLPIFVHSIVTMAMVGETVRVDQSFKSKTSIVDIHILVVDDDATSLAIVSAMLRTLKYEGTFFFLV